MAEPEPSAETPARGEAGSPFPHALAPAAIGSLALPHRIVMGSMHLGTEAAPDAGERLAAFYGERARGGGGLIVTGGWAVSRVGAGGASYGFVNEDAGARVLERVAAAVRTMRSRLGPHSDTNLDRADAGEAGARIALQLFHAGRYAFEDAFGLQPVAPSPVASRFSGATPRPLGAEEIEATIEDFAAGARRAVELGFDAVEVMGSEGYLVDQFLSPLTNRREDEWGGGPAGRMRFGVELATALRAAVGPDFPLLFRMTGADLMPGGSPPEDVAAFAEALAAAGVDALNVGIGWHESPVPTVQGPVPPGAWLPWARAIKEAVGGVEAGVDAPSGAMGHGVPEGDEPPRVAVIAGNRVNRLADAEAILAAGGADLVSMSRPFLADAELIARARAARPVNVCIACNQACIDRSIGDGHVSCLVNPRAGFEPEFPLPVGEGVAGRTGRGPGRPEGDPARRGTGDPRRFAVIGGGPAGLEAARALASLGQRVELFEAEAELGGQFRLARLVPGKEDFGATISYFEAELARLGVEVELGRPVGEEDEGLLRGFDGVVLASGVLPRRVDLPGADLPHVVDYPAAFLRGVGDASRVAIVGAGGIAVDLAHRLSHRADDDDAARFYREYNLQPPVPGPSGRHLSPTALQKTTTHRERHVEAAVESAPAVTIMRRGRRVGEGMGRSTRWVWLDALRRAGVETRTGVAYRAITPAGVELTVTERSSSRYAGTKLRPSDGDEQTTVEVETVPADIVVIAAGQERNDSLRPLLERLGLPYRVVGGAEDPAELDAVRAFGDGLRAAYALAARRF